MTAEQIQTIIDNHITAINTVLTGGKSYTLNDGQGIMQVTRETLNKLNQSLDFWNNKQSDLSAEGNFVSLRSVR